MLAIKIFKNNEMIGYKSGDSLLDVQKDIEYAELYPNNKKDIAKYNSQMMINGYSGDDIYSYQIVKYNLVECTERKMVSVNKADIISSFRIVDKMYEDGFI